MIGIHNKYSSCAASIGCIDQHAALTSLFDQTLDRGRIRTDHCHDTPRADHVAKTDIDQLHICLRNDLFQILNLFADLFNFCLHIHYDTGNVQVLTF